MKSRSIRRLALSFLPLPLLVCSAFAGSDKSVNLGTAGSYAVLAGSTVTNTESSVLHGNLGVWPGTAVTGFPPGLVVGGVIHAGVVLTPGVYFFASSAQLTGTLTLNDLGNPNAVFVFQIGSTLTTASSSSVIFSNSLTDKNVYWQVGSSATLGTSTSFQGNILALTSITLNTGASIGCGSALARNGAVTLDNNVIGGGCGSTTTVPEPGTMGLLGTGLAILIGSARRRLRI